jgi:D-alanine transaminase
MSRIAYVNGAYVPHSQASVHIEDRGYQFADGVYEVVYRHEGRLIDPDLHLDRLDRSLAALRIPAPVGRLALLAILDEMGRRNRLASGLIYIQITRGTARREHAFPRPGTRPSLVVTMRRTPPFPAGPEVWTGSAITLPDQRWARCDIKSVGLLPNVLAKQAAREQGATEAILYDSDGMVTEGSSTNVWIVDEGGTLRTRALSARILPGCTRAALVGELGMAGTAVQERAFSVDEMRAAREIFITSATSFVKPILRLDDAPVGDGGVGPVARRLFALFAQRVGTIAQQGLSHGLAVP